MPTLRIATRKSRLALKQAELFVDLFKRRYPQWHTELVPISTRGDQIQDRPLSAIGGKALFLKELEEAMLDGRAQIAVHSMKDVPAEMSAGFALGAVLERDDPYDAFVSRSCAGFDALPDGARLGSSSLRRQSLAKARRPDLKVVSLRGNVNTRLAKLDAGEFDAILLAGVGLRRLGLENRIRQRLRPPAWIPAAGQGAIGIECRADDADSLELLKPLQHEGSALCVGAERAVVRRLEGSCQVPVGAYARLRDGRLYLAAMVGRPDGSESVRGHREGSPQAADRLGDDLGAELLERGGKTILRDLERMTSE